MSCLVAAAALGPNVRITLLADRNMCVGACTASLEAAARHIAALVKSFSLSAYLPAHGPFSHLTLRLALRSMRALATLALPPFDADLLAAVPPMLARLAL
jgi:hypothetical protein